MNWMNDELKDWFESSQSVDLDLIRDIVLFRQNQLASHDSVYDVVIKGGHLNHDRDKFVTYFVRILIDVNGESERINDDMVIDMNEYLCLLRQKKLKEIGI